MECVFCEIINNKADAYKVFESDDIIAFLDIDPISEGHVLIIPKIHESSIEKIPIAILTEIMELSQRIVKALQKIYAIKGYTLMQNGREFCDFGHFHVHIFPRYENDGYSINYPDGEFECSDRVAEQLRKLI